MDVGCTCIRNIYLIYDTFMQSVLQLRQVKGLLQRYNSGRYWDQWRGLGSVAGIGISGGDREQRQGLGTVVGIGISGRNWEQWLGLGKVAGIGISGKGLCSELSTL